MSFEVRYAISAVAELLVILTNIGLLQRVEMAQTISLWLRVDRVRDG